MKFLINLLTKDIFINFLIKMYGLQFLSFSIFSEI